MSITKAFSQSSILINNNGTSSDPTDDFVTFNLNPPAPGTDVVSPYTYTVTATQGGVSVGVMLSDGSPAVAIPYGISSPLRTASGSLGQGDITLSVVPNYGTYPAQTYVLADPGSLPPQGLCMSGQKTVTYRYRSPVSLADAVDWGTYIPKFAETPEKTLTNVSITLKADLLNSAILETQAAPPVGSTVTTYKVSLESYAFVRLNGNMLPLTNNFGKYVDANFTLPAPITVPAQGTWGGDVNNSTLHAMTQGTPGWLEQRAFSYMSPTSDSRWVTNQTGNAADDDDMWMSLGNHPVVTNSFSFNAAGDLALFSGSGYIPLTYSTLSGYGIQGGGNNYVFQNYTHTYFEVEVTYTYDETCSALPVKLQAFNAHESEGNVHLDWKVDQEKDFDRYEVMHSTDARNFDTIGTVYGNEQPEYNFVHTAGAAGIHYYRLKMIDTDGTYSYSRIISVGSESGSHTGMYPNPAKTTDLLRVDGLAERQISRVVLHDSGSRIVRSFESRQITQGMSLSGLTPGLYIVKVVMSDGSVINRKVIVDR